MRIYYKSLFAFAFDWKLFSPTIITRTLVKARGNIFLLFIILTVFINACSKTKSSESGSTTTTTTTDDDDDGSSSTFSSEAAEIDSELDECTDAAISTCGEDDSCLVDAVNACLGTAIPDWADASCEDADFAAAYPDICNGEEVDTCEDTMAEALEETAEETGANLDCSVDCYCAFLEDYDTEVYESCTATCEEEEEDPEDTDDDGLSDDCVGYYAAVLANGTISQDAYEQAVESVCSISGLGAYYYELGESLLSLGDVYDDTGVDWSNGNDSSGSFNSAEVASPASEYPGTIITGLKLNAYKSGGLWTDADHLNVECAWVAWVDLKVYAETGVWDVHSELYGYSGEGTSNGSCDDTLDTTVDLSGEPGIVFTGLYLDGEDCGIEAGVRRATLNEKLADGTFAENVYDEEANNAQGSYYAGADIHKSYYYMADGESDYDKTTSGEWCKIDDGANNGICDTTDSNDYEYPDVDITEFSSDGDIAIVGLGIAANGDGKRCAVNIYVEYQQLFLTEKALADCEWHEDMTEDEVSACTGETDDDE